MLENYEESIQDLRQELVTLGMTIEDAISKTWTALETMDPVLADTVCRGDDEIDALVRDCMKKDLDISMMQSPVASDWRELMATLKILSDLERIADHCADISQYVIVLKKAAQPVPIPAGMKEMYAVMSSMVSDVLDFYKGKESAQAELMKDKDDMVDQAFNHLLEKISADITADAGRSRQYVIYVLLVKYIERMADHANNIAEWIIYREKNEIHI
ncbi:MAG: phosphate signaling complex protein PhoU [Megasphaera sp.]|jgi:phosphate transport system protein|nr:phosphate signaling complex protein PhoU [Megasphaera sp.]MCI1247635.1 phosphate signaling complex protein PhoU [Megasphaera sp.]